MNNFKYKIKDDLFLLDRITIADDEMVFIKIKILGCHRNKPPFFIKITKISEKKDRNIILYPNNNDEVLPIYYLQEKHDVVIYLKNLKDFKISGYIKVERIDLDFP